MMITFYMFSFCRKFELIRKITFDTYFFLSEIKNKKFIKMIQKMIFYIRIYFAEGGRRFPQNIWAFLRV